MKVTNFIFLVLLVIGIGSCSGPTPRKVVAQTWLNINNITAHYSPSFFENLMAVKLKENITIIRNEAPTKGTAVEYVTQMVLDPLNESLKKVEKLPFDTETKPIIDASLEAYRYARTVVEKDYLAVAAMIDENQPADTIEMAVATLFEKHDTALQIRLDKLDSYVLPYAEKHKIHIKH
ncbi:hypothetical protein GCM10027051_25610 [Niabella terrae]